MSDNIRFGVIGCGKISARFCTVMQSVPGAELYAVAARELERAKDFGARFNCDRAYGSYEELAGDGNIDIVYIGTVHSAHYQAIRLCLESGRRVLCEKPMSLHEAQARELTELAREKELLLVEAMWSRMNPVNIKAKSWVSEKKIGEAKLVTASFCTGGTFNPNSRVYDPELGGGSLYDLGVYVIEYASGVLGENPTGAVAAVSRAQTGVDDYVSISLGFPGGALGSLTCGITARTPHTACIYGTDGFIVTEDFWQAKECCRYNKRGNLEETFSIDFEDGFSFQFKHVMDMIRRGKIQSDLIPWEDTISCAAVFDKILGAC